MYSLSKTLCKPPSGSRESTTGVWKPATSIPILFPQVTTILAFVSSFHDNGSSKDRFFNVSCLCTLYKCYHIVYSFLLVAFSRANRLWGSSMSIVGHSLLLPCGLSLTKLPVYLSDHLMANLGFSKFYTEINNGPVVNILLPVCWCIWVRLSLGGCISYLLPDNQSPQAFWLKTALLSHGFWDQEFKSSLAEWFWLRDSQEVAVSLLATVIWRPDWGGCFQAHSRGWGRKLHHCCGSLSTAPGSREGAQLTLEGVLLLLVLCHAVFSLCLPSYLCVLDITFKTYLQK